MNRELHAFSAMLAESFGKFKSRGLFVCLDNRRAGSAFVRWCNFLNRYGVPHESANRETKFPNGSSYIFRGTEEHERHMEQRRKKKDRSFVVIDEMKGFDPEKIK